MSLCSRRSVVRAMAGAIACAAAASPALAGEQGHESLGSLAAAKGLLFGSAMGLEELDAASRSIFARETRLITPSNELKLTGMRWEKDRINFSEADALIAFATHHGLAIRGHTLIWNEYQPDWVYVLSKNEIADLLDSHIDLLCTRYRGRIHSWDVVNEPLATHSGSNSWFASGPFFNALGVDYIARSLHRARAADPSARLIINETHTERGDAFGQRQRTRFLRLIDQLQQAGVPIDGVGLQGHLEPSAGFAPDAFLSFCQELASRNLEIQITELDVTDDGFPDDITERDNLVADAMSKFLDVALQCRAVKVVATWHLADNYSYPYRQLIEKQPLAKRRPRPVLFDETQCRKPAWHAVAKAFEKMPVRA